MPEYRFLVFGNERHLRSLDQPLNNPMDAGVDCADINQARKLADARAEGMGAENVAITDDRGNIVERRQRDAEGWRVFDA